MALVAPFGTKLPLADSPFNSRISANYTDGAIKNYYMLAFNPGFALQASELNEIQELFALNAGLSQRSNHIWSGTEGYVVPFWDGAIPYSPLNISISSASVSGASARYTVTVSVGWFLWTEPVSKVSFWVYNETAYTQLFSADTTRYVGFVGELETIICCPSDSCDTDQDASLRDNSQGDTTTHNTCGASRKKVTFTGIDINISGINTATFFPILKSLAGSNTLVITFLDGQPLYSSE